MTKILRNILILTDVSGIQRLRVSDLGEKLMMPTQLRSVRNTHATIVHSGCKATFDKSHVTLDGFTFPILVNLDLNVVQTDNGGSRLDH